MSNMDPQVAAVFAELEATPGSACIVGFEALGFHAHLSSNGEGGWRVEMHSNELNADGYEEVMSVDEAMTAEEVDFKMTMLSMLNNAIMETIVAESNVGDEAEDFLRQLAGE